MTIEEQKEQKRKVKKHHDREKRLIKEAPETPHGGSYRETSEGLWFVPLRNKQKKTNHHGSTFIQKRNDAKERMTMRTSGRGFDGTPPPFEASHFGSENES